MKRILQLSNIISLIVAVFINYYINAKQTAAPSISEISGKYDNLLTPAGYAFAIWGLIYLALFVFAVYQSLDIFTRKVDNSYVTDIGWWFVLANVANATWVIAFTQDMIGLSVLIMLVLFFSLLKIVLHTNMERWDAPKSIIAFLWWPISLYFGWINVAIIANISAWHTALGWTGAPLSPEAWAIMVFIIAAVIFISMIWKRSMREYASVGIWGIIAIGVNNLSNAPVVAYAAFTISGIILLNVLIHGYRNRATAPFAKRTHRTEEN